MDTFVLDKRFPAIAVTGGPCAGKSTFLAVARQRLEDHGMRVVSHPEVVTELKTAGFSPVEGWSDPLVFQEHLLQYMLYRENLYYRMLKEQDTEKPLVLFCDRGALDAIAYISRNNFLVVCEKLGCNLHHLRERYTAVVHLVTAADGAEEHYTLENNEARDEDPKTARQLDRRTRDAWVGHQHLSIIDNSTGFRKKIHRALTALSRVLTMPIPKEKERKFILHNWSAVSITEGVTAVQIRQTYLIRGEDGVERRLRMRTIDGSSSYYYTEKRDTETLGVREEKERQISRAEYEKLLDERDPEGADIVKTRHCVPFASHHFEVDEYHKPISHLVVVEVEVADMDEAITFPPGWELEEVTGNARYKNHSIATGSLT